LASSSLDSRGFAEVDRPDKVDPYGAATQTAGTTTSGGWILNPYSFGGGIQDRATGHIKFGGRWYDPTTGTWTQQDTYPPGHSFATGVGRLRRRRRMIIEPTALPPITGDAPSRTQPLTPPPLAASWARPRARAETANTQNTMERVRSRPAFHPRGLFWPTSRGRLITQPIAPEPKSHATVAQTNCMSTNSSLGGAVCIGGGVRSKRDACRPTLHGSCEHTRSKSRNYQQMPGQRTGCSWCHHDFGAALLS